MTGSPLQRLVRVPLPLLPVGRIACYGEIFECNWDGLFLLLEQSTRVFQFIMLGPKVN